MLSIQFKNDHQHLTVEGPDNSVISNLVCTCCDEKSLLACFENRSVLLAKGFLAPQSIGRDKMNMNILHTFDGPLISSGTNDSPRSQGSVNESAFAVDGENLGEVSEKLRGKKP